MPKNVGSRTYQRTSQSQGRTPEEYRLRWRHLLDIANTCQDTQIAARLRVIAADYFDSAGQEGHD
jgi:hypothetical protein